MGELDHAFAAHQEAIRIRLQANSDRIGNHYSNLACLLLRMGRPEEAEENLAKCPSLKTLQMTLFSALAILVSRAI